MAVNFKLYILLPILMFLYSCDITTYTNSKVENGVLNVDLGTKQFNDPFPYDGYRPQVIKDIITNYFSWAWTKNDTIEFERNLGISFNEDAVRSKSRMLLYPYLGDEYANYVKVYLNDAEVSANNPIVVDAALDEVNLHLRVRVHPELGDTIISGFVLASQENVDNINEVAIQEDVFPVVQWTSTQEIGWPLLLWIILLAIIVALLYAIAMLVLYLIDMISMIGLTSVVASVSLPTISMARHSLSNKTKKAQKKKEEKENKKDERKDSKHVIPFFKPRIGSDYYSGLFGVRSMVFGATVYCKRTNCEYYKRCMQDCQPYDNICPEYSNISAALHDTPQVEVDNFIDGEEYPTYKMFTKFLALFYEQKYHKEISSPKTLWNFIGFQEYSQRILPEGTFGKFRQTFSSDFTDEDFRAFSITLMQYAPKLVILWGAPLEKEIKKRIPMDDDKVCKVRYCGRVYYFCFLHHPSIGFSYDTNLLLLRRAYTLAVNNA